MTTLSNWAYIFDATFWSVAGRNKSDEPIFSDPIVLKCSWRYGGRSAQDVDGVEFVPTSRFYLESSEADRPDRDWRVVRGVHTGQPPRDAEVIRAIASGSNVFAPNELPDWELMTG